MLLGVGSQTAESELVYIDRDFLDISCCRGQTHVLSRVPEASNVLRRQPDIIASQVLRVVPVHRYWSTSTTAVSGLII